MKIRVLLLRPRRKMQEIWIDPTHENLMALVGGEIDMSSPLNDGTVIISREGADAETASINRAIRNSRGQVAKTFYGTIIVAGLFMKLGELDSLTDGEIQQISERLEMAGSGVQ